MGVLNEFVPDIVNLTTSNRPNNFAPIVKTASYGKINFMSLVAARRKPETDGIDSFTE